MKTWTTKDGYVLVISDMGDSHLVNTIRMLDRFAVVKQAELEEEGWSFLCSLRGEMAQYYAEQDLNELMEHGLSPCEIHPAYPALLEEANKRGLEI